MKNRVFWVSFFLLTVLAGTALAQQALPIKGTVYCYNTRKGTPFMGIGVTCPGLTNENGQIMIQGENIPIFSVREISFPKKPVPKIVVKLKNGKVLSMKAQKKDVPLCIFMFNVPGGVLPLDSFDIDKVVFK